MRAAQTFGTEAGAALPRALEEIVPFVFDK
jgi:hypothetical protein